MEEENPSEIFSFAKALELKYAECEPKSFDNIQLSPKRKAIMLSQPCHKTKQILTLDACKIGNAGEEGEIAEICPNLLELDLTKNYLHSWEQVFLIISQLPKLTFLNISCNPLDSEFDEERLRNILENNTKPPIQKLVLNNTKVQLEVVFKFLSIFSGIEEIYLSLNYYGSVTDWPEKYPNIKRMHFSRNDVQDWEDVIKIGKIFPSLKSLILCENPVKNIVIENGKENFFPELSILSLSKTEIRDWQSVDEMRKLPALEDLRIVGVPLGEKESEHKRRQLLVSRLPNIRKLNGSIINEDEREDAERMFIRHYMDSANPPQRYHELVEVHGRLDKLVEVDMSKKDIISMSLYFEEDYLTKLVVDLAIETESFKKQIGKKVGLPPSEFRMFYCDLEMSDHMIPEELKFGSRRLYMYRMADGDRVLVRKKKDEKVLIRKRLQRKR